MKRLIYTVSFLIISLATLMGQNTLKGRVTDSQVNPLAYANVVITHVIENETEVLLKNQMGATSDFEGYYVITGVLSGTYKVTYIYIGYEEQSIQVSFSGSDEIQLNNIQLEEKSLGLDEVVITAQVKGQMAAINQQVNSLAIKNVVSADRIQQNPDANAAEALGRLPGVTVTRSGGEANGIVIRGMQGYNKVTVNGVDVPVNLTSISQYALQNVEVFKSNTADMDAAAPAGTVNLKLGVAPDNDATRILAQVGYNNLNSHFNNYKFNIASNRRFFEKKLGLSINLSTEATDRSTEQLLAGIGIGDQSVVEGQPILLQTNNVRLRNVNRTVRRNSAILTADFRFSPSTSIEWSNILIHNPGGALNTDHLYNGGAGNASYSINDNTRNNGYNYSSILTAKHLLGRIKVDYAASVGYAHSSNENRAVSLYYLKAFEQTLSVEQMQTLSHKDYVSLASSGDNTIESMNNYTLASSEFAQPGLAFTDTETNNLTADLRINMELPYNLGGLITGNLKWGGRYKRQDFERETFGLEKQSHDFPAFLIGTKEMTKDDGSNWRDDIDVDTEHYDEVGHLLGSYLLDQESYNDNFLNEGYNFGWYPEMDKLDEVMDWWNDMTEYAYEQGDDYWIPLFRQIQHLRRVDFTGNAQGTTSHIINHYAGYLMTEMKIGTKLHFVPGVRYEKYYYDMNDWNIRNEIVSDIHFTGEAVSGTHDNQFLLPMVQLKYKPTKWLHGLASYTETLKRPGVGQLSPGRYEDKIGYTYKTGNPNLQPEHWKSFDIGIAAHGPKIGLFSVTLFYKQVEDKIASTNWTRMSTDSTILGSFQPGQSVNVTEIGNHPYVGIAKGVEVEWQTNFNYLPKPFSYFTLNLNYSYINNKTTYVYVASMDSLVGYGRGDRPIFEKMLYDQLVEGPMTNQPSQLANASLGFSYKNFETYLSYQYIGDIFLQKTIIKETDLFKTAFHRFDLQARYKLPVKGMEILLNMANLSDTQELKKRRGDDRPTSIERYGWTADLGLRYRF